MMMKQVAVVALVLVVLLTGLPIVAGMSPMPDCSECRSGLLAWGMACAVLVAAVGVIVAAAVTWLSPVHRPERLFLFAADLDPPPRLT